MTQLLQDLRQITMYWKHNTNAPSEIDILLGKEDVTLQEVMDVEDIINECRSQNKNLLDFLLKPEVLEELVALTTKEPSPELDEKVRFKYPNVACELLTCDLPVLNERLAQDEGLLDKLYAFLENEPPLNSLLASYFSKIMGALIAKKTEQVLDFLKAKDTFISLLLKHLGTSAIMDLSLKLMTQVEGEDKRQNILNWLDSQQIMQSLVSLLNPKVDRQRNHNVAQLLCDFVRIARDNQRNCSERPDPDPLLNRLESSETIALLLDNVFGEEKCETTIVGGIQVLLAILDVFQNSTSTFSSQNIYNSSSDDGNDIKLKQKIVFNTTQAIKDRLKNFHDLLLDPPKGPSIITTVGVLDPPLGNTRLQVVKLFAAIISSNNEELLQEFVNLGSFQVLLDLFFKYPWNNLLHTQVENCLISAIKTCSSEEADDPSNLLCKHLLVNCKLIERILDAFKANEEQVAENGVRQGYMGHLISIVNKMVELCSGSLGGFMKEVVPEGYKALEEFKEGSLSETNKIQDSLLGGVLPNNSLKDNDDYSDIPFSQASAMQQQLFAQYQMQHLNTQGIDGYSGFNDDAFNDADDAFQTIDHRTDMNFELTDWGSLRQTQIFKQICARNINTLDDADDQVFEDKEHTFQTVIEKQGSCDQVYSSDSDEDTPPDTNMDVDPWASPKPGDILALPSADPWSGGGGSDSDNAGWADFSASFGGEVKEEEVKLEEGKEAGDLGGGNGGQDKPSKGEKEESTGSTDLESKDNS